MKRRKTKKRQKQERMAKEIMQRRAGALKALAEIDSNQAPPRPTVDHLLEGATADQFGGEIDWGKPEGEESW